MLIHIRNAKITAFIILISILYTSCVKEIDDFESTTNSNSLVSDITELQVPSNFDFSLDKNCQVNIQLKSNDDSPLSGVIVRILDDAAENNGKELYKGITDINGILSGSIRLSKTISEVYICSDYIGIANNAVASISGNSISLTLGGSNPQRIKDVTTILSATNSNANNYRTTAVPTKTYLGSWNSNGLPSYLISPRDVISHDLLERINSSLPEYRSVPQYHNNYLASNANTLITQQADVWMTFIHEGAANRNTIGYYAYNKNNPPQSTADISTIKIVFPNFSYSNGGGSLVSGDKVYLGSFGPDTVIGFILLANAYNITNQTVGNGFTQFYTNSNLNPEATAAQQIHNVALWDIPTQKLIIGFEDLNRNGGDNDFNDAIFSISSSPSSAISTNQIVNTTSSTDTDGDGVADANDDYPNDATLAYNSYYPSATSFGHLAFEDLWPYRGDYDMNDLIVGYKFNTIKNSANNVMAVQAFLFVNAVGGSYENGFGFELPVNPSDVTMVLGQNLQCGYINLNGNATEAGQNKAVIIAFDNATNLATRPSGYYINTQTGSPVVISDTIKVTTWFTHPIASSLIGNAPFNPFMISNKRRGYEIHLANMPPTNLVDQALFNTGQDRTNIALGRYYLSDKNIPWALNIPGPYPIVLEKNQIIQAYTKFQPWCQSGGSSFNDWYEDKPGYRDNSKLLFR